MYKQFLYKFCGKTFDLHLRISLALGEMIFNIFWLFQVERDFHLTLLRLYDSFMMQIGPRGTPFFNALPIRVAHELWGGRGLWGFQIRLLFIENLTSFTLFSPILPQLLNMLGLVDELGTLAPLFYTLFTLFLFFNPVFEWDTGSILSPSMINTIT